MKNKEQLQEIDMKNRDNLNKEQALNDFRMEKAKKSKNLALGVTLGFIGLTVFSAAMFLASVFPPSIGGIATLVSATFAVTGGSIFAKQNSKYKNCLSQQQYFNEIENKIARRKARELQKQQEAEKERQRKIQKEKEAKKKTPKQLLKEGKIKFVKEYNNPPKRTSTSQAIKQTENSTFTAKQKDNLTLQERKNEDIKAITSFLDEGK